MDKYGLIGYPSAILSRATFSTRNSGAKALMPNTSTLKSQASTVFRTSSRKTQTCEDSTSPSLTKKKIISYMDELSEEARQIGAVNVVRIRQQEGPPHLKGFNSDVIGFTRSIAPLLESTHKKALILGTGGASKAIHYGLRQLGLECRFVSRTPREGMLSYDHLTRETMKEYTVIVNCTPVGMYPARSAVRPFLTKPLETTTCFTTWCITPKKRSSSRKGASRGHREKRPRDAAPAGLRRLGILAQRRLKERT